MRILHLIATGQRRGAEVFAADLIAALAAEGTSRVYGVDLIDRGYEDFEGKLAALGADVERL